MKIINLRDVPEEERQSPKGKFRARFQEISVALGRNAKSFDLRERHPFDLMLSRIPPGASFCPYHAEAAQWELYLVISGRGLVRDASGTTEVSAGDSFFFAPGQAHELSNPAGSTEDFAYYVVADNPINDSCYYPDSHKWAALKEGDEMVVIKGQETNYFDGEE